MLTKMSFPYFLKEQFDLKVEETNKKLQKYESENFIKVKNISCFDKCLEINGSKMPCEHFEIELEYVMSHTDNYKVIGLMRKLDEDKVLYFSNENITSHKKFKCEHCNKNRDRKAVFVLEDKTTKQQICIGSTCINEFTGKNIEKLLYVFFSFKTETEQLLNQYTKTNIIPFSLLTQATYNCYKINSRYCKSDDYDSTRNKVMSIIHDNNLKINENDVMDIKNKLILTYKNFDDMASNFNSNVYNSLFNNNGTLKEFFTPKCVGLTVWAIFDCLNKKPEDTIKINSEYVGEKACKITKDVIIKSIKEVSGTYGFTNVIEMQDLQGNMMTTFTTAKWSYDVKIGDTVKIDAIVKDRCFKKFIKYTTLKNVRKV